MLTLVSSFTQTLKAALAIPPDAVKGMVDGKQFARSLQPALDALVQGGPDFADRVLSEWVAFCGEVARRSAQPDRYAHNYWRVALAETAQVVLLLEGMARGQNEVATSDKLGDQFAILKLIIEDIDTAGFAAAAQKWRGFNVEDRLCPPAPVPESYFTPTVKPTFTMDEFAEGAGQFTPSQAMLDEDWSAAARAAREKER
jgi:hypothetical protein